MTVKQILVRFYVSDLDTAIPFYENLLHAKCQPKVALPDLKLEIAHDK